MRKYYIYALIDPLTNMVRYIGRTDDIKRRYSEHLRECNWTKKRSHKSHWISRLLKNNSTPIIEILEETIFDKSGFWEIHYISLYKSWGFNLINKTSGGDGITNYKATEEEKYARSIRTSGKGNTFFGKNHTEETKILLSNISKQRFSDPTKNPMYGKKHKNTSLQLMRLNKLNRYEGDNNPNAKKLYEYNLDNTLKKVWTTAKECADYYNISRSNISTTAKHNTNIDNGQTLEPYKIIYKKFLFKFR